MLGRWEDGVHNRTHVHKCMDVFLVPYFRDSVCANMYSLSVSGGHADVPDLFCVRLEKQQLREFVFLASFKEVLKQDLSCQ